MSKSRKANSSSASRDPERAPRPRIKQLEVMVAEVIRETREASTLLLFTGNDRLEYKPGHFLTIDPHQFPALDRFIDYFEALKGRKEPPRAYSMCSAPHESHLAITVKEERFSAGVTAYPPLLSPLLVFRTPPGTRMVVTGFKGPYVLPPDIESKTDHLVHICAGSGAVPNLAIIKHALHHDMKLRHTMIYGNKTRQDIIYRKRLDDLVQAHPGKLEVIHALSREEDVERYGPSYRTGRVNEELIRASIPDPSAVVVYTCGPAVGKWDRELAKQAGEEPRSRFMETVLEALANLGITRDRIRRESYG
ncbi:MAG: oxidoreductase [bacterium]|nr:oxidoreductase [bacterium]